MLKNKEKKNSNVKSIKFTYSMVLYRDFMAKGQIKAPKISLKKHLLFTRKIQTNEKYERNEEKNNKNNNNDRLYDNLILFLPRNETTNQNINYILQ